MPSRGESRALQPLPSPRPRRRSRGRSRADAGSRGRRDGRDGRRASCLRRSASRATVSQASTMSPSSGALGRSRSRRRRRERTARWSACPCRASARLSSRMPASSASRIASSAPRRSVRRRAAAERRLDGARATSASSAERVRIQTRRCRDDVDRRHRGSSACAGGARRVAAS